MINKYFRYVIPCTLLVAFVTGHGYKVTAAAPPLIVGTWSGTIQTIDQLKRPFFISTESPSPTNEIRVNNVIAVNVCGSISGVNNELPCALPVTNQVVSFNNMPDEDNLVKGTIVTDITLQIALNNGSISGTVTDTEGSFGTIDGIVLKANRFFLMNITINGNPGPCAPGQFQGTASIVPSNKQRLIFMGSGLDHDCQHQLISGHFTKP